MSKDFEGPRPPRKECENGCNGQTSWRTSDPDDRDAAVYRFWKERIDRLEEYLNRRDQ